MYVYQLFLYFIIYSFFGWVAETIYCSIPAKRFVYRGFLNGPLCPIYGFGALLVLLLFNNHADSIMFLFLGGMLVTSALEYFASFIMEKMFDMKWWDYSDRKFNINGRIRLKNSILFGIGSVLIVHYVHPEVIKKVNLLSGEYTQLIATVLFVLIVADTVVTVVSIYDLKNKLFEFENVIEDKLGAKKADLLDRRILEAFPQLKDLHNPDVIHRLRKAILKHRIELKERRKEIKNS